MSTTRGSDEAAIHQWVDQLLEAVQTKNVDVLRTLYTEDIVSFDVQPPLQHLGVDAKLKNWNDAFTMFGTIGYDVRDVNVTVGEELAVGRGFFKLSGTLADDTAVPGMWVRWTGCFRRQGDGWAVFHDQVSVPFDPAQGNAAVDLTP